MSVVSSSGPREYVIVCTESRLQTFRIHLDTAYRTTATSEELTAAFAIVKAGGKDSLDARARTVLSSYQRLEARVPRPLQEAQDMCPDPLQREHQLSLGLAAAEA